MSSLYQFAATYAMRRPVALNVRLSRHKPRDVVELSDLCLKHNQLDLYLWLSFRFPEFFVEQDLCLEQKAYAITLIENSLDETTLIHKFSHSSEYQTVRNSVLNSDPLGLPPTTFGAVRESYVANIAKLDVNDLYAFPRLKEEEVLSEGTDSPSRGPHRDAKAVGSRAWTDRRTNSVGSDHRRVTGPDPLSGSKPLYSHPRSSNSVIFTPGSDSPDGPDKFISSNPIRNPNTSPQIVGVSRKSSMPRRDGSQSAARTWGDRNDGNTGNSGSVRFASPDSYSNSVPRTATPRPATSSSAPRAAPRFGSGPRQPSNPTSSPEAVSSAGTFLTQITSWADVRNKSKSRKDDSSSANSSSDSSNNDRNMRSTSSSRINSVKNSMNLNSAHSISSRSSNNSNNSNNSNDSNNSNNSNISNISRGYLGRNNNKNRPTSDTYRPKANDTLNTMDTRGDGIDRSADNGGGKRINYSKIDNSKVNNRVSSINGSSGNNINSTGGSSSKSSGSSGSNSGSSGKDDKAFAPGEKETRVTAF